jgi:hypothetical protein
LKKKGLRNVLLKRTNNIYSYDTHCYSTTAIFFFRACLGSKVMEWIEGARIPYYLILNSEGL